MKANEKIRSDSNPTASVKVCYMHVFLVFYVAAVRIFFAMKNDDSDSLGYAATLVTNNSAAVDYKDNLQLVISS